MVEEVAEGRAHVSWSTVRSKHAGKELIIYVFRDAMKFDNVPELTWDWATISPSDPWYTKPGATYDGVRLPASALQLQQIADLCGCMMLTPKVIDLIWLQAQLRFNPVVNTPRYPGASPRLRTIVARTHYHVLHHEIEEKIRAAGGDDGSKLIASVGKYWVLINHLLNIKALTYREKNACNYGWPSSDGRYNCVTPGLHCWQDPGFQHNHDHWDPSQAIRLMFREAVLIHENGSMEPVLLEDVASDPKLAGLIHHDPGTLRYLRQAGVPKPRSDVMLHMYAPLLAA